MHSIGTRTIFNRARQRGMYGDCGLCGNSMATARGSFLSTAHNICLSVGNRIKLSSRSCRVSITTVGRVLHAGRGPRKSQPILVNVSTALSATHYSPVTYDNHLSSLSAMFKLEDMQVISFVPECYVPLTFCFYS